MEVELNEYITLRVEEKVTVIYIAGERFRHCQRLVLQIPKQEIDAYDEINSIDEASEVFKTLYQNRIIEGNEEHQIKPEEEFWGHCSNLQAWIENGYDTRLLHSNLAFPLLKKLVEAGDTSAKKVFKEEIAKRLEEGNLNVVKYLLYEGYISYLDDKEISSLNTHILEKILQSALQRLIQNVNREKITTLKEINEDIRYIGAMWKDSIFLKKKFYDKWISDLEKEDYLKYLTINLILNGFSLLSAENVISYFEGYQLDEISDIIINLMEKIELSGFYLDDAILVRLGVFGLRLVLFIIKRGGWKWDDNEWYDRALKRFQQTIPHEFKRELIEFFSGEIFPLRSDLFNGLCAFLFHMLEPEELWELIRPPNYCFLYNILIISDDMQFHLLLDLGRLLSTTLEGLFFKVIPEDEKQALLDLKTALNIKYDLPVNNGKMKRKYSSRGIVVDEDLHITSLILPNRSYEDRALSTLPDSFKNLRYLEELNLSGHNLPALPDAIKHLTRLETLNLSANNIAELPPLRKELKSLKLLDLSKNKIEEIPKDWRKRSLKIVR